MICKCGYQNEPDDLYCAQCGRRLSQGKKGGKGWIIAIVVILLLAAGAVAAWFIITRGEPSVEPTTDVSEQEMPEDDVQDPQAVKPEDVKGPDEEAVPENGWDNEHLCYYVDGKAVKGLQEIEGQYYYFNLETGKVQTGWVEIEQAWHFFSEDGPALPAGWYSDDKGWFYLEEDGKHHTETPYEQPKQVYILDEDGYLVRMEYYELACIESNEVVNGRERPIFVVPGTLTNCTKLTIHQKETSSLTPVEGVIWEVWLRNGDEWIMISETPISAGEGSYTLTFSEPRTFDGICIIAKDIRISSTLTSVTVVY